MQTEQSLEVEVSTRNGLNIPGGNIRHRRVVKRARKRVSSINLPCAIQVAQERVRQRAAHR